MQKLYSVLNVVLGQSCKEFEFVRSVYENANLYIIIIIDTRHRRIDVLVLSIIGNAFILCLKCEYFL